ncbi:glucosaminidase domain-containing protein [Enterococcus sp. AZ007]|uniref:glucosaminidase domain-containing protein n=1 Tax=Enterococcus sp. AZ007 TaxID=2774839 RepID=UPI003F231515
MKKALGSAAVILLLGITLRLVTGQQLRADDAPQQTTDTSVTSVDSLASSEPAPAEEPKESTPAVDDSEEIPVIPENSTSVSMEESVSEAFSSSENTTDSSSEESVESSTSSSSSSSTSTTSKTSTTSASSSSSSSTSTTKSSSSTVPTKVTCDLSTDTSQTHSSSRQSSTAEPPTSSTDPSIPETETTVVVPTGSAYSGISGLSSTATLGLDKAYQTSDFADSELKGFELPLLSSFKDQRQAALIYEAIKQLSTEQEESLTNESFTTGIYQRVLQQDLTNLTEQEQSDEQLVAGDVLYFEKDKEKNCAGIYLGDGYLLAVKETADEEQEEAEETHKSSEKTETTSSTKEKKATKKATKKTTESKEKTSETTTKDSSDEKVEAAEDESKDEEEVEERLIVQQTSDRDAKGKWLVLREETKELTDYGQGLLKEYPASMDFTASAQTQKFVETIGTDAQKLGQEYDVFASVMIAQAILESGSGTSGLSAAPYYNLFGIKGSYKGNAVNMSTQEDGGSGNMYTIQSAFRAYPNYAASLGDYVELIRGGISGSENYYQDVWRSKAKNYLRASEKLTGKYATDTSYHRKLTSLISVYHLTQYDKQQVQAETPLNGGNETGIFIKGKGEIPEEYAKLMKYEDYNGVNYNTSGSYPVGQCTWYAFNRVAQLGKQVDDFMGNGGEWAIKGKALGYEVSQKPKVGRLISFRPGVAGSDPRYGHVAFVEAVGPNGILISEGNVYGGTTISYRVIPNDLALSNSVAYVTPK